MNDSTPTLRIGLESPGSANISSRSALPAVNVNPVPAANPVPDVSARSALNLEVLPPATVPASIANPQPVERSGFGIGETGINASGVVPNNESPVLKSGFVGFSSNSSVIEQRSLNGLNGDASPVNSSVSSYAPGGSFVPSFFKSFELREKRGEISEGSEPVVDISLRSGVEQPAKEDYLVSDVAVRSNVEQPAPLNVNLGVAAPPQLSSSLEGASKDAHLYSGSNVKSPINPYVNVYPLGSFGY